MTKKTTDQKKLLEPWQIEDAARLMALFAAKKAEMRKAKRPFTQEIFAEANGFASTAVVWQLLNAHRPLNIKAAAAFARGLGVKVEDFSPRLAVEVGQVVESQDRLRLVSAPVSSRRLQWISDDEAEILSEYRACAQPQKETALGVIRALPKEITDGAAANDKG